MRVLEIGCGPGVLARKVARRVVEGHVLAIDRSATAIERARTGCEAEIATGRLSLRCVAAEDLVLEPGENPFDLAFAIRVGVLDRWHPEAGALARKRIAAALKPGAKLLIDAGKLLRVVRL
jgi:SAM-dependent methyltransferase